MNKNRYKLGKKLTLFGLLEKYLPLNSLLTGSISTYYLYRFFYFFMLGLLYIWNAHYHEKMLHQANQLQPVVDGLRVKYMRLQSNYMLERTQSEVAKRVTILDIYESNIPPYKIRSQQIKRK